MKRELLTYACIILGGMMGIGLGMAAVPDAHTPAPTPTAIVVHEHTELATEPSHQCEDYTDEDYQATGLEEDEYWERYCETH